MNVLPRLVLWTTEGDVDCFIGETAFVELVRTLPDTPGNAKIFNAAASHASLQVRAAVARKANLGRDAIRTLSDDPSMEVRLQLLESDGFIEAADESTLLKLIAADPMIAQALAGQLERFPENIVCLLADTLAKHSDPSVRLAIADCRETPSEIRVRLTKDVDPEVSATASSRMPRAVDDA